MVMGILNVTPDSFSDGGRYLDPDRAVAHGLEMAAAGADVIDVGGESSRPGALPVPEAEERARVVPVISALAPHVRVSVDTCKASVAAAALEAGATLVNDITASPELWRLAASAGAGYVAMHMQGTPATMQRDPRYGDVAEEVFGFLATRAALAEADGVGEVWVDPGIGFGKTPAHNLRLLRQLPRLVTQRWPVLVGTSRKGFLGLVAARPGAPPAPPDERLAASLASAVWAMACGASMVRVHDVSATVQAAVLVGATRLGDVPGMVASATSGARP
jgi:dihydropteroate synthase